MLQNAPTYSFQSEKLRLEMENEYLARELVNSKIEMRKDIDLVSIFILPKSAYQTSLVSKQYYGV